ncbi:hypothetical protein [Gemmata sp.]|uniref:hypothetical protein n=1 Tax=Gemmata sp. TaxID=1914242 RepID=UPI003F71E826
MTYSDLVIHYERLRDVRAEIVEQGDTPPPELEERLRQVRAVLTTVRKRREQVALQRTEVVRAGEAIELELADVQAA